MGQFHELLLILKNSPTTLSDLQKLCHFLISQALWNVVLIESVNEHVPSRWLDGIIRKGILGGFQLVICLAFQNKGRKGHFLFIEVLYNIEDLLNLYNPILSTHRARSPHKLKQSHVVKPLIGITTLSNYRLSGLPLKSHALWPHQLALWSSVRTSPSGRVVEELEWVSHLSGISNS